MIEMARVTEFVDHQVFDRVRRQEQQLIVEADIVAVGTATPARFLAANADPVIREPGML